MTARKASVKAGAVKAAPKTVPKTSVAKAVPQEKRASVKRTLPGDGVVLYSAEEIASRLRIGRTLVYYLMGRGEIDSLKIEGLRRVTRDALERYIEERQNASMRGRRRTA